MLENTLDNPMCDIDMFYQPLRFAEVTSFNVEVESAFHPMGSVMALWSVQTNPMRRIVTITKTVGTSRPLS